MVSKILLIQTAYIGDLLLSIPLMKRIKKKFPESTLTLLCKKGLGLFYRELGLVDELIEVDKKTKKSDSSNSWKTVRHFFQTQKYDLILSPHESLTTARLVSQIQANEKVAFSKWWNFLIYTQRIKKNKKYPEALRQLSLLIPYDSELKTNYESFDEIYKFEKSLYLDDPSFAGQSQWVPSWASMSLVSEFKASYEEASSLSSLRFRMIALMQQKGLDHKPFIVLAPGSVWGTKKWTGFLKLIPSLIKKDFKVVLIGGPEEVHVGQEITLEFPEVISFIGQTSLLESAFLLFHATALITNDNGAMHLGAATEVPTVAIFGPTTLNLGYRPWQNRAVVVQNWEVKCRPCGKHGPKKCPKKHHDCMNKIQSSHVLMALDKVLKISDYEK